MAMGLSVTGVSGFVVVSSFLAIGKTSFDCGFATGATGINTVGVIVVEVFCPIESVTEYITAVAVPIKSGSGSKVTVPSEFTVYVPWPVMLSVVAVQLGAVSDGPHNMTLLATKVVPLPATSFASWLIVWF